MIQKYRIGKNRNGWYLTIPRFDSFDMIEGLPSYEAAVEAFDQHRFLW